MRAGVAGLRTALANFMQPASPLNCAASSRVPAKVSGDGTSYPPPSPSLVEQVAMCPYPRMHSGARHDEDAFRTVAAISDPLSSIVPSSCIHHLPCLTASSISTHHTSRQGICFPRSFNVDTSPSRMYDCFTLIRQQRVHRRVGLASFGGRLRCA